MLASTIAGMRLFLSIVLVVTLGAYTPAKAEPLPKSLVLIDTGFDTSIEMISKSVIFESCIMDWSMCPNSTTFQEGTGAATISSALLTAPGICHGTQMASIVISKQLWFKSNTDPTMPPLLLHPISHPSRRVPIYL